MGRPPAAVRALAAAAVASLALTACGSTVSPGATESVGPGVGQTGTGTVPVVATGTRAGAAGSSASASGTAAVGGSVAAPGATVDTGGRTAGTRAVGARGAPAGTLKIGIQYREGDDTAHAAFGTGAKDVPSGANNMAWYRAAIAAVNASGGVLGRKLEPVFYPSNANSTESPQAQEQAACQAFTEDNHVFAALIAGFHTEGLVSCLAKKNVYVLAPGVSAFDDAIVLQRYPNFALAGALQLHRMAKVYVDGLVKQGFLTPSSTIGLVTYDSPEFVRANEQSLKPTLAAHGLHIKQEVRVNPLTSLGAAGNGAASMGSAVLSFRNAGVDRVLFFASSGMAFVFMTAAESQAYRPLYGLSTADTPQPLAATAPAAQLAKSVGVGWVPSYDVADSKPGPAARVCDAIIKKATGATATAAYGLCDQVSLFAAAARAGGALTPSAVSSGLQRLGQLPLAVVPTVRYGGGVRDGVDQARSLAFDGSCTCFHYTSAPYGV